jgi:hypothetical protein
MPHLNSADWWFWLRWTAATAIALGLCGALGPSGLFAGPLLLAIAQALALKGYWRRGGLWFFLTLVGGYGAIAVLVAIALTMGNPILMVVGGGAILGGFQALALKGVTRRWVWWPLVTIAVLLISIGWFVPLAFNAAIYAPQWPTWRWLTMLAGSGILGGALKGAALVGLLPRSPQ